MLAVKVTVISETAEGDITHPKYHRLFHFFYQWKMLQVTTCLISLYLKNKYNISSKLLAIGTGYKKKFRTFYISRLIL